MPKREMGSSYGRGRSSGASGGLGVGVRARERGWFSPAAVAHGSGQRWRRAEGRLGLYRWAAAAWKEGKQGGFGTFQTGAGGFPSVPRHGRAEEEGEHRGRKVDDAADEWV